MKRETARAERLSVELKQARAAASALMMHESDAELARRLAAPAAGAEQRADSPPLCSPLSWTAEDSPPRGGGGGGEEADSADAAGGTGSAQDAVRSLAAKLLEQRRARAAESVARIAQLAHHRKCAHA